MSHPAPHYPLFRRLLAYERCQNVATENANELRTYAKNASGILMGMLPLNKGVRKYETHLIRLLHNFVAGVMTHVSLTRELMNAPEIRKSHRESYQLRVNEIFSENPPAKFIQALRNYTLHADLPPTVIHTKISPSIVTEVYISTKDMLPWDRCTGAARIYLSKHPEKLRVLDLLDDYEAVVAPFDEWYVEEFRRQYAAEFEELDRFLQKEIPPGTRRTDT